MVETEACRADTDPPLVQLLCPMQTGWAQHVSVSVIGGVVKPGKLFTVCEEPFMPVYFGISWWSFSRGDFILLSINSYALLDDK